MQHVLFSRCIKNVKFSWLQPQNWSVQLCNGFTLCCGFICFISFNYKIVVNFGFNFYYPRINKDKTIIIIIKIIIIIEAHFYTSYCCFSLDYFTFSSIQNPPNKLLLLKLHTSILPCRTLLSILPCRTLLSQLVHVQRQ